MATSDNGRNAGQESNSLFQYTMGSMLENIGMSK